MKKAKPITLWAVAIIGQRSTWINPNTVRWQRKEAIEAYLEMWNPEHYARKKRERNKTWRTVKITVEEIT